MHDDDFGEICLSGMVAVVVGNLVKESPDDISLAGSGTNGCVSPSSIGGSKRISFSSCVCEGGWPGGSVRSEEEREWHRDMNEGPSSRDVV